MISTSFDQAQFSAREWLAIPDEVDSGHYTIANAMDDYFQFLESDGRPAHTMRDARYRDGAFIRPKLGDEVVSSLTSERLRRWRDDLSEPLRACEHARVSPKDIGPFAMMMRDGRGERRQIELGRCFVHHSTMRLVMARPLPI
jgi:hypothetical protein